MAKTNRGQIQRLPRGSFRLMVYAGTDPVTGKERLLRQACPTRPPPPSSSPQAPT